jgi:lipid A 4'-phosphatase
MGFSKFFILFTLLCLVIFALFPNLDIATSSFFYREGDGFYLRDTFPFSFLHKRLGVIIGLSVLGLLLALLYQIKTKKVLKYFNKKAIGFLLTFLLLGPGLITNVFFKEYSGRVRPVNTELFGGEKAFTPYYSLKGSCQTNCSFISGHAAAGFFFLAFAYVMRSRKIFLFAMGFGVLMALTRVVQGGHFLSDVLFAFIVNFAVLKVLYYFFYKEGASLEK